MKTLSIKLKITLWFTVFMILLCAIAFAFITVLSYSTATKDIRNALTALVDRNMQEIEYDDGHLDIDDDFVSFYSGVYCLIFYEDGTKISGYSPYSELEYGPFEDMEMRTVRTDGETFLIYDRLIQFNRHKDIWLRGLISESGSSISNSALSGAALIVLPLLIVLASVGGFQIARRLLRPIQQIRQTAEEIGNGGDLTKRIEMADNGDELHELTGTFNRMFDRLEKNYESERHFTSDASHELRTPVAIILANCEYAFENASGKEELYEVIGAIQKQGYRMAHLIESLLDFTRLEQNTEAIARESVNLSALLTATIQEDQKILDKNISLTAALQPNIMMQANAALITQLLDNLIQNAVKYGKENGAITVSLTENSREITLTVEDNGVGIAADKLPNIWNRFYRVDQSRGTSKGLGLGLAMVRQIARLHNGDVEVHSELDKGSSFVVRFQKS